MLKRLLQRVLLPSFLSCTVAAQVLNFPSPASRYNTAMTMDAIQTGQLDLNLFTINTRDENASRVQSASASVSQLDLKAPGKACREYEKGFQLLMRKDLQGAVVHLENAAEIYPSFVAAHNALGSAYLGLDENEQAR